MSNLENQNIDIENVTKNITDADTTPEIETQTKTETQILTTDAKIEVETENNTNIESKKNNIYVINNKNGNINNNQKAAIINATNGNGRTYKNNHKSHYKHNHTHNHNRYKDNRNRNRQYERERYERLKVKNNTTIPDPIKHAFPASLKNCRIVKEKLVGFSKGRHILNLPLLSVYNLRNGINARRTGLIAIIGLNEADELGIEGLSNNQILDLSNYAYEQISAGITQTLYQLDLNCYVSTEKVINAGNVIKNYNGAETYGGKTIRAYLTHISENAKYYDLSRDEKVKCLSIVNQWIEDKKSYKLIKSLPFSIFRYKKSIKTDENGKIVTPDVEAKYNLKRILGKDVYNSAKFNLLNIVDATILESKLIEYIRLIAKEYASALVLNLVKDLDDSKIKDDIIAASNIDNVVVISDHGHIHDIVDYMEENTKTVLALEKTPEQILSKEEKQSIIQIEYAAVQQRFSDITDDMLWISDLGEALNGKNAQYGIIKGVIELGFVPRINCADVTNYDIMIMEFNAIVENAKHIQDKDERRKFVNLNIVYCAKKIID